MGNILTEQSKAYIGRETGPGKPKKIESGVLRKFAKVIGHNDPIYDQEVLYGTYSMGMPMPPAFLFTNMESGMERDFELPLNSTSRVRGGDELEILSSIYDGDVIQANTKIIDMVEKEGKKGSMAIIKTETVYTNQRGEVVMIGRTEVIRR